MALMQAQACMPRILRLASMRRCVAAPTSTVEVRNWSGGRCWGGGQVLSSNQLSRRGRSTALSSSSFHAKSTFCPYAQILFNRYPFSARSISTTSFLAASGVPDSSDYSEVPTSLLNDEMLSIIPQIPVEVCALTIII